MTKKVKTWKQMGGTSTTPHIYLTEKEKRTGEAARIQHWLDLADMVLKESKPEKTEKKGAKKAESAAA